VKPRNSAHAVELRFNVMITSWQDDAFTNDSTTGVIERFVPRRTFSRYGETAASMPVKEIMRQGVVTVSPEESVNRVMKLMTRHRVRHFPDLRERKVDLLLLRATGPLMEDDLYAETLFDEPFCRGCWCAEPVGSQASDCLD
jgi:CBS domain